MIAPPKPPSNDELEALIKEARARQLRRRLLGAAGIAIAAAIGLGVYAVTIGGNPGNLAQGPASAGRATGSLCRASQLSTSVGFQGATQSALGGVGITNRSGSVCSLPSGRPVVSIRWPGRTLSVPQRAWPNRLHFRTARVLEPGATATIEMQWWAWCPKPSAHPATLPRLALRFPNGFEILTAPSAQANPSTAPSCRQPDFPTTVYVSGPLTE